jgi:hypothetical protein
MVVVVSLGHVWIVETELRKIVLLKDVGLVVKVVVLIVVLT